MNKPEEEVERKTIDVVFATIRGRTYYENLLQNVGQLMQHERCKSIKFEQWAGLVKNVVEQRGGRFLCHEKQHPEQYKYKYYVIKDENQIRRKLKKAVKNRKYRGSNIGLKIDPLLMHFVQQHLQVQQQQQQGLSFTDPHQEQRNSHPTPQQANSELILRNRQLQQLNYRHHHQQQGNITFRPYQLQQQEPTHLLQQQRLLDQLQQQQYHLRHQPQQNLQLSQMYQHHHHHQHQQQQLQQLQQMQRQQFMQQQFMQQQQQQLHHDRSGGDRSDDGSDGDGDEDDGVSVGNDDNTGTTERDNEQNDDRDDGTSSKGEDDNYNDDFGSIINDDVNQLKTKTNCLTSNSSTVASVDDKINPKDLPLNSEQTAAAEDGETTTKDDDDDDGYEEDDAVGDDSDSSLLLRNSRFDVAIIIIIYTSAIWWSIFRFLISIMTIRVMLFLYLCLGFGFTVMKRHSTNKLLRSSSSSPPTSSEQQRNSIPGTGDKQIKQQQQQQQHVNGTKPAAVAGNTAAVPKKIQPVATGDVMNNDGFVANNDNNEDNHEGDVEISSAHKLLTGERSDYDDGDGDSLAEKIDQNHGTEDDNALNRSSGGVSISAASTTATATSDNDDVDIDDDVNADDIAKECVDNVTVIEPSNGKRKRRSCSLGSSNDASTQKKFLRSSSSSLPTRSHSISDTVDKPIHHHHHHHHHQHVNKTKTAAVAGNASVVGVGKRKRTNVVKRGANNVVNHDDSNRKKSVANNAETYAGDNFSSDDSDSDDIVNNTVGEKFCDDCNDLFSSDEDGDDGQIFTAYSYREFLHVIHRMERRTDTIDEIEKSFAIRGANNGMDPNDTTVQVKAQYGRLLPVALNIIFKKILNLTKDDVFLDIGHGIGNTCFQASFCTGCESRGIEVVSSRHEIAERLCGFLLAMHGRNAKPPKRTVGKIELVNGSLDDPKHKRFLTDGVTRCLYNNFNDAFAARSNKKCDDYTLDQYAAGIFASMAPSSIMVTLHPLPLLSSRGEVNFWREKYGMAKSEDASFFSMEKIPLAKACCTAKWLDYSKNGKMIEVYKYKRLSQSSSDCSGAVFLCCNPKCQKAIDRQPIQATKIKDGKSVMNHCECNFSPPNLRERNNN